MAENVPPKVPQPNNRPTFKDITRSAARYGIFDLIRLEGALKALVRGTIRATAEYETMAGGAYVPKGWTYQPDENRSRMLGYIHEIERMKFLSVFEKSWATAAMFRNTIQNMRSEASRGNDSGRGNRTIGDARRPLPAPYNTVSSLVASMEDTPSEIHGPNGS